MLAGDDGFDFNEDVNLFDIQNAIFSIPAESRLSTAASPQTSSSHAQAAEAVNPALHVLMDEFHSIMSAVKTDTSAYDSNIDDNLLDYNSDLNHMNTTSNKYSTLHNTTNNPFDGYEVEIDDHDLFINESNSQPTLETLIRNNNSLKDALHEERNKRVALQTEFGLLMDSVEELRTQKDVEIDSYKIDIIRLNNRIRLLTSDNTLISDIYDSCEENVQRLLQENRSLQEKVLELTDAQVESVNSQLTNRLFYQNSFLLGDNTNPFASSSALNTSGDNINSSSTGKSDLQYASQQYQKLSAKFRRLNHEKDDLRKQFEELKKKERQFHLCAAMSTDSLRRLKYSHSQMLKMREDLEAEKQRFALLHSDYNSSRSEVKDLQNMLSLKSDEISKCHSDILELKQVRTPLDRPPPLPLPTNTYMYDIRSIGTPMTSTASFSRCRNLWPNTPKRSRSSCESEGKITDQFIVC